MFHIDAKMQMIVTYLVVHDTRLIAQDIVVGSREFVEICLYRMIKLEILNFIFP